MFKVAQHTTVVADDASAKDYVATTLSSILVSTLATSYSDKTYLSAQFTLTNFTASFRIFNKKFFKALKRRR